MINNRKELVEKLIKLGYLKSINIINAFNQTPRENFISISLKEKAYFDSPLEIGFNQTISAPHMIAIMCEALDLKKGQKILEIGTGSGYHAAIVSKIIGNSGFIYTIERHDDLAVKAKENFKRLDIKNIKVCVGDGSEGLEEYKPYDRIYVTCAAPEIPQPLISQLKTYGQLLIPVGKLFCELILLKKEKNKIITNNLGGCAFVPLIGKYGHKD